MAQLSANSQGTLGIDGGGTQSSLMSVLNAVGYMGLMTTAIKEANKDKGDDNDKGDDKEDSNNTQSDGGDNPQEKASDVDVEWNHNTQNSLEGSNPDKLSGQNPKRLKPSPPGKQQGTTITENKGTEISRKENLSVAVQIGSYRIADKYSNLPSHFNEIPQEQKQSLGIAMSGGIPSEEVSIEIEDEFGRKSEFSADTESNNGWRVIGEPSEDLSAQAMQEELLRQQSAGPQKIKKTMNEISAEDGPQMFSGSSLVIFTDSDEVVVYDKKTGVVRDAVRLDTIGNQGEQAVQEAAREAAGAFRVGNSASKGIPTTSKPQKQRQLTP